MSIRPISSRMLDRDQFKKNIPPPVPNSAQCPTFIEQPNFNKPIYDTNIGEGGTLYEGRGKGYSTFDRQQEIAGLGIGSNLRMSNNGEFSRKPVFQFTDRMGIDTRYNENNKQNIINNNKYTQIQTTQQNNTMVGTYLRPQDSRNTRQNYFNQNTHALNNRQFSNIGTYSGKGFVGNMNNTNNMNANNVSFASATNRNDSRDPILSKYSSMYTNTMNMSNKK